MARGQVNRHHVLWTRREHQRSRANAMLRDELIIPLPVRVHTLLHEEVMPPLVPNEPLAQELYSVVTADDYNPMEKFGMAIMHLYRVAHDMQHPYHRQAQLMHSNLLEQAQYFD